MVGGDDQTLGSDRILNRPKICATLYVNLMCFSLELASPVIPNWLILKR